MTMNADESEERGPGRRARRDSLFLLTIVNSPNGRELGNARVRNLSSLGLMADCERPFVPGDRVWMKLRGVGDVEGSIAWANGDRIGVTFDREIDPKLARRPVTESKPVDSMPDYLRVLTRKPHR